MRYWGLVFSLCVVLDSLVTFALKRYSIGVCKAGWITQDGSQQIVKTFSCVISCLYEIEQDREREHPSRAGVQRRREKQALPC